MTLHPTAPRTAADVVDAVLPPLELAWHGPGEGDPILADEEDPIWAGESFHLAEFTDCTRPPAIIDGECVLCSSADPACDERNHDGEPQHSACAEARDEAAAESRAEAAAEYRAMDREGMRAAL